MVEQREEVPYGTGGLALSLPETWDVRRADPPPPAETRSVEAAARDALTTPIEGPRLRDLVRPGSTVTIAITDATRPCPDHILVPLLLEELRAGGVRHEDITVLIALGMHRHSTAEERAQKLGAWVDSLRVEDAHGASREEYLDLGALAPEDTAPTPLPAPVPVRLHRRAISCDLLISTGIVEPHQYAGFSGGRKTVAIGCAADETIRALHSIPFLEHAGTRLGRLDGNPLHAALDAIARRARLRFALNVALDGEGRVVGAAAGAPTAVLQDLTARLAPFMWAPVGREPFDAVIVGVGAPKDANLYQASRALTYMAFAPKPVLRDGGWVVLVARCEEGAGRGPGEEEFLARMRDGASPGEVVRRLRETGFGAGGQRAFMVARALERYRCLLVAPENLSIAASCHMKSAGTAVAAVEHLRGVLGTRARVLVIAHGLATLATLE
jgi:nickel-dependent lactate racemase